MDLAPQFPFVRRKLSLIVTIEDATQPVNLFFFQTYPTEYNTEKEAEEAAAKLACDKLNLGNQPLASPPMPTATTSPIADVGIDVLIDRIVELVGNRSNGVWSTRIELEYSQKFGQALPPHWSERIETYQTRDTVKKRIHIERPIQDRCIIMPYIEQVGSKLSGLFSKQQFTGIDILF